jgi:hypothetical protein
MKRKRIGRTKLTKMEEGGEDEWMEKGKIG